MLIYSRVRDRFLDKFSQSADKPKIGTFCLDVFNLEGTSKTHIATFNFQLSTSNSLDVLLADFTSHMIKRRIDTTSITNTSCS